MTQSAGAIFLLLLSGTALRITAAEPGWTDLLANRDLSQWEVVGDGVFHVLSDGTLTGQRDPHLPKSAHDPDQSWLFTKQEFGDFDLHLEYWVRLGGNSGVAIHDESRARWACGPESDPTRTPAHVAYEIQIENHADRIHTGSVYQIVDAPLGPQKDFDWNSLDIEVRRSGIRTQVNGTLTADMKGDPHHVPRGPIGLQLHDRSTVILFRNIRIREVER